MQIYRYTERRITERIEQIRKNYMPSKMKITEEEFVRKVLCYRLY